MDSLSNQSKKYLTDIRLFRYREIYNNNYLDFYILNINVSEKLLSMISIFEIIYRNKINKIFSSEFGNDYLNNENLSILNKNQRDQIRKVSNKVKKKNPHLKIKNSKIITYLSLNFWSNFIKNNNVWCKYLHMLFSMEVRKINSIRSITEKLELIIKIRNMISHHERVISKRGINIAEATNTIKKVTLWLIEKEDKDFYIYIEDFLTSKQFEISALLKIIKSASSAV